MPATPYLSIVIPAFNEGDRIADTLPPLKDFLATKTFDWELVLVDDGSVDDTIQVFETLFRGNNIQVIRNGRNRGKGYSVRQGVLSARGEVVLISDADLSTPIHELDKLKAWLADGFDMVIGSRSLPESQVTLRQAWYRQGMGRIFNGFVRKIAGLDFIDTQCGFKCFNREPLVPVFSIMTVDRFSFDVELLFIAERRGLKTKEVPVEWKNVLESRVHIVKDSMQMLWDLIRIRLNGLRGRYDPE